jgi:hypothetical protein
MNKSIKKYLAKIGSKGGKKSKRVLTSEQARKMVQIREENRKLKEQSSNGKFNPEANI